MIIFCGLITMATSDPAPAIDESRVVLGDLPDDFLRIMVEVPVPATEGVPPSLLSNGPTQGMLQVTIIEARLAKNYGMMKMDPFVRIITGNFCKRTAICQKGSISPRWNQTVEVPVLPHFQTVTIEVVDFRTLGDRTIATGQLPLSQFIEGNVVEDWFPLSGKQGKDKEGVINLRFQFVVRKLEWRHGCYTHQVCMVSKCHDFCLACRLSYNGLLSAITHSGISVRQKLLYPLLWIHP
eukprot:TRINITY_DN11742_c0_g2_i12.p2 TRINITY_DN11742_c0_g2~~TRINITY_DN11742_c0_g2_i12.p2  ORF type:complete len:238 (+),score=14.37 TRINITY_DN11742_c0_g2_i12:1543-2256(+)